MTTINANNWDDSARSYANLSPKISFYQATSRLILEFGEIQDCQSIVDLGCGSSGLVANRALQTYHSLKSIYCIDASKQMLQECARRVKSDRAIFIHSKAENFERKVDREVDLVVVNSAFWLFNVSKCLTSIHNCLNRSGRLIFNLSEWDFKFPNHRVHPKYFSIDRQLKKRQLNVKKTRGSECKFSRLEIDKTLSDFGFRILKVGTFEIEVKKRDWLNFYSIPMIVQRSLPKLPLQVAQAVLKDAIKTLSTNEFPPVKWIFYEAGKVR